MGVGEAKQDAKMLEAAKEQLADDRRPAARTSAAPASRSPRFKLREGMPVGLSVTLRGERAYEFLDRLTVDRDPADPRLPRA